MKNKTGRTSAIKIHGHGGAHNSLRSGPMLTWVCSLVYRAPVPTFARFYHPLWICGDRHGYGSSFNAWALSCRRVDQISLILPWGLRRTLGGYLRVSSSYSSYVGVGTYAASTVDKCNLSALGVLQHYEQESVSETRRCGLQRIFPLIPPVGIYE